MRLRFAVMFLAAFTACRAQEPDPSHGDDVRGYNDTPQILGQKWRVHDMDRPRPTQVKPGPYVLEAAPSDAIVLFDGKDLSKWEQEARGGVKTEVKWKVESGEMVIAPRTGRLVTKESFGDCQLHIEWMIPKGVGTNGQAAGNSGVEFMKRYEVQVLESNSHQTYADGGAGAIYGVWPPLVNASRPQGEWNVYDIFFEAPRFESEKLVKPATITVMWNGILVQNHKEYVGATIWRQNGRYSPHPAEQPLSLQDHGHAVHYKNIWLRKL